MVSKELKDRFVLSRMLRTENSAWEFFTYPTGGYYFSVYVKGWGYPIDKVIESRFYISRHVEELVLDDMKDPFIKLDTHESINIYIINPDTVLTYPRV